MNCKDEVGGMNYRAARVEPNRWLYFVSNRMKSSETAKPDFALAVRAAKLWPHRQHEANSAFGLLCRIGLHRWRRLNMTMLVPDKNVLHCFWCSKIKIDGIAYDV